MRFLLLLPLIFIFTSGCGHLKKQKRNVYKKAYKRQFYKVKKASVSLNAFSRGGPSGVVTFEKIEGKRTKVSGKIRDLKSGGIHGFHVHALGNCRSRDGKSAGDHYNPYGVKHGNALGDLGNIKADAQGVAHINKTLPYPPSLVVGRSLIVHEKADDLKKVSSAGKRLACGIIGIQKEKSYKGCPCKGKKRGIKGLWKKFFKKGKCCKKQGKCKKCSKCKGKDSKRLEKGDKKHHKAYGKKGRRSSCGHAHGTCGKCSKCSMHKGKRHGEKSAHGTCPICKKKKSHKPCAYCKKHKLHH